MADLQALADALGGLQPAAGLAQIKAHKGVSLAHALSFLDQHVFHHARNRSIDSAGGIAWLQLALNGDGLGQGGGDGP